MCRFSSVISIPSAAVRLRTNLSQRHIGLRSMCSANRRTLTAQSRGYSIQAPGSTFPGIFRLRWDMERGPLWFCNRRIRRLYRG